MDGEEKPTLTTSSSFSSDPYSSSDESPPNGKMMMMETFKNWKKKKQTQASLERYSRETIQSAEMAKDYIEKHFETFWKELEEKENRKKMLREKLTASNLSEEEKEQNYSQYFKQETQLLRLRRKRLSINSFQILKVIGKGAFGEILLVKMRNTNDIYAMKKIPKAKIVKSDHVAHIRDERNALATNDYVRNPWITRLYYSFQDKKFLYLVMEFVPGGDMITHLIKFDIFPEETAKFYIAELILGIDSIHRLNYIHRDIKPDNILLDARGHLKLSDLGLCTGYQTTRITSLTTKLKAESIFLKPEDKQSLLTNSSDKLGSWQGKRRLVAFSFVGTPDYMAPEILNFKDGYTETCDWWSVGIILFEMIIGYPPFYSDTPEETYRKIVNWKETLIFPSDRPISVEAKDLIQKLCCDMKDRLGKNGVEEIKRHPFFNSINWEKIRDMKAPIIPILKGPTDCSYFEEFESSSIYDDLDDDVVSYWRGFTYKSTAALRKASLGTWGKGIPAQFLKNIEKFS